MHQIFLSYRMQQIQIIREIKEILHHVQEI